MIEQELINLVKPDPQTGDIDLMFVTQLIGVQNSHTEQLQHRSEFVKYDQNWNTQTVVDFYRALLEVLSQAGLHAQVLEQNFRMMDANMRSGNIA